MTTQKKAMPFRFQIYAMAAIAILLLFISGCGSTGASVGGASQPQATISVSVNPSTLSFGNVTVGTNSTKTVVVTNTGNADLVISAVTVTGAGFTMNSISFPLTITAGSSYTASVIFSPQSAGAVTGSATIASNASGSPTVVSFTGTGVTTPTPAISVSATSVAFGSIVVGNSSTKTVAVTNSGTADLVISGVTVSGAGFSITSTNFPQTVSAGASFTLSFVFNPQSIASAVGSASIASNAGGSAVVVSLAGAGAAAPVGKLSFSSASVAFGNVTVGASSSQNVTVSNTGTANVIVSAIGVTGSGFSVNATTPFTLPVGGSSIVGVGFSPSATGAVTGTATLTSNASNSLATVSLSATGVSGIAHSVDLGWVASTSVVSGYNVYRGSQMGGPYQRINPSLQASLAYNDPSVVSGQTYFYVVTATDANGNESAFSNEAVAVIP